MNKRKWLVAAMAVISLLGGSPNVGFACGPFIDEAILAFDTNPDFPLKRYVAGELGIIRPNFAKSYLVVAYRFLSNKPLTKMQQDAIYDLWKYRVTGSFFHDTADDAGTAGGAAEGDAGPLFWLKARGKVVDAKNQPSIDVSRRISSSDGSFDWYANCTADSFSNAVKILDNKIANHGLHSPFVKDWVTAQDKVFCHCGTPGGSFGASGKNKSIEPPFPELPTDAQNPEVVQDRAYQHAAALFYAEQFDKAFAEFKVISGDAKSPYARIARYLMARCLVRKATLGGLNPATVKSTLASAGTLVREMIADPSMAELATACRELLGFITLRYDPNVRLSELSAQVLSTDDKAASSGDFYRSVDDYTFLLLNLEGGLDDPYAAETKPKAPLPAIVQKDDLSDWITIWEREDKTKFQHAVERWRQTKSEAWLLAALHLAPGDKSKSQDLLSAAREVNASAPGFLSISYEAARVQALCGDKDGAVKEIAKLRADASAKQLISAVNLLMDLRGRLPMNMPEFVDNAVRKPAALAVFGEYLEEQFTPPANGEKKTLPAFVFGFENARFVNERMSLNKLVDICLTQKLPKQLQADADQAAWTRALLLDDGVARAKVAAGLERDYPDLASLIKVTEQGSESDQKFAAVCLILKNPGMRPYIRGGALRVEQLGKLDTYGDNWWDKSPPDQEVIYQEKGDIVRSKLKTEDYPQVLSADQQATGAVEKKKLQALGSAPTYLCKVAAEYASKHLSDPRVPEALSLAVRASHYGSKESQTTAFSKKCFQILHTNFPQSPFTKKTPYFY